MAAPVVSVAWVPSVNIMTGRVSAAPTYEINGAPFPLAELLASQVWAVDSAGGVFEETNADLVTQLVAWARGEWADEVDAGGPSTPIQDPRSNAGIVQLLPAADTQDAAYFMSKEAAFFWLQNFSGRTISGSNRAQQVVQGVGAQLNSIGQDFNEGNVGAGFEGIVGEIVNTTPLGAGTGLGNQLLQGAGALQDPTAQEAANAFQATATAVDAVGQGAMTGGLAGGVNAGLKAVGALNAAAQAAAGGAAPPAAAALTASTTPGLGIGVLAAFVAAVYAVLS